MSDMKSVLRALNGETLERPPFWFMRQAGRYLSEYRALRSDAGSFLDLCYNSDLAAEVTLQPIDRFGMDAAILFADILLIPQGLGCQLDYREGEGPVLSPIRSAEELSKLSLSGLHDQVGPVYETVRKVRAGLSDDKTLIGFAGSPWTVATYIVEGGGSTDHANTRRWAYVDPVGFGKLIDLLIEATVQYLGEQIKAGADALQLFDTWAGILSETGFQKWCVEPTARIVAALKQDYPDIPIIGFPRAAGPRLAGYAEKTGVAAVGLDYSMPLEWARDHVQKKVTLQGNLDPLLLLAGGDAMLKEAERILKILGQGPFIFNLGHGIVPQTPVEHVRALADLLRG